MTIKLEVGKRYLTRDGRVAQVTGKKDGKEDYNFIVSSDGGDERWLAQEDGHFHSIDGRVELPQDLILEVV